MTARVLLDTCALLWIVQGEAIADSAVALLSEEERQGRDLAVSPITAWEIGMLVSRRRLSLAMNPNAWFRQVLSKPGLILATLDTEILVASSFLPGTGLRDPVDRIIAATAREYGYRLLTRDRLLLDYAREGHITALPC